MAKYILGNSSTNIIAENVKLTSEPTLASHAVTKGYVDDFGNRGYVHNQTVASDVWVINHNMKKRPGVVVIDSAEVTCVGDIRYDSENSLTIFFSAEFSGTAYLN